MVTKNILRKISLFLLLSLALRFSVFAGAPKYVFFMIGDGMGINAVAATERYHAAVDSGIIGRVPLVMTQLPHTAICHTYSLSNGVTDSSAAGTACRPVVKPLMVYWEWTQRAPSHLNPLPRKHATPAGQSELLPR